MKTQINHNGINIRICRLINLLSTGIIVVFCLLATPSFSQDVAIQTNATYKLPDPAGMQTLAQVKGAIVTAELAGQALNADAEKEKAELQSAENDYGKAQAMKSDYLTGLDSYTKNGYNPYMADLNSYTPNVTNYAEILTRHNNAVAASNVLAPEQRNAATVASLNSEKTELDTWKVKLDTWKNNLDDARSKLDAQRTALLLQKQQYETAYQNAMDRLNASQAKLKAILDQLILCANYADKCRSILISKFNYTGTSTTGYFGTPVYKGSIADLNTNLEKLKQLSGKPWDGN